MKTTLLGKSLFLLALAMTPAAGCDSSAPGNLGDVGQLVQTCADRADLSPYVLAFTGVYLGAYEGAPAHVKTTMYMAFEPNTSCSASNSARVQDGAFAIDLENRTDGAAYPFILGFFDLDANGRCDVGVDASWGTVGTASPDGTTSFIVDPEQIATSLYQNDCYGLDADPSFAE